MKKAGWLLMIALLGLQCASDDKDSKDSSEYNEGVPPESADKPAELIPYDASKPASGQYCYITKMYTDKGVTYINADYIRFLMGNEAVAAARKNNDAIPELNAKGDTIWSLPDNYYIVDENTKIKTLALADNVQYYVVHMDEKVFLKKEKPETIKQGMDLHHIFILTLDNKQRVTRIQQQYLP